MQVIIGILMGAALGVMLTLIFVNRETITITYSGYQPLQNETKLKALEKELNTERSCSDFWRLKAKRDMKKLKECQKALMAAENSLRGEKMKNCTKRELCPDENTAKCKICNPLAKPEPVRVGLREAIAHFKEENETFEHMLGNNANEAIEYNLNKIAIEAMEAQLEREYKLSTN